MNSKILKLAANFSTTLSWGSLRLSRIISDRSCVVCIASFLTLMGLLAIYASSSVHAAQLGGSEFLYVKKQTIAALAGMVIVFGMGHLPFVWISRIVWPLTILSFVLLLLVHVPGLEGHAKGASRWIVLPYFTIQPAEIAKLSLILFLARNLSHRTMNVADFWKGIFPNLLICGLMCVLLMLQPDFGSTFLIMCLCFLMLIAAGLPLRSVLIFTMVSLVAMGVLVAIAPYRLRRLMIFLDPWKEIQTGGFQIIQSFLGFQNGGFWGAGLGESRQKLFFLPEAHTDFILSVIGEELGVLGVVLICVSFFSLALIGLRITLRQKDAFKGFLSFGITAWISLQALINMSVAMGLLPTKGMTLPFVSNGANSLLVFLVAIAILSRIAQELPVERSNETIQKSFSS